MEAQVPFWSRIEQSRARVLDEAVQLASVEGLHGMSIGGLAAATSRAKSSIGSLYKSKEALQLAVLNEAERIFVDAVIRPADGMVGLARVKTLLNSWIEYVAGGVFRGGCFLAAAVHEVDGRPGVVRDRVSAFASRWMAVVEDAVEDARQRGEVDGAADVVVFRMLAIGLALNIEVQMGHRERGLEHARRSVNALLHELQHPSPVLSD